MITHAVNLLSHIGLRFVVSILKKSEYVWVVMNFGLLAVPNHNVFMVGYSMLTRQADTRILVKCCTSLESSCPRHICPYFFERAWVMA